MAMRLRRYLERTVPTHESPRVRTSSWPTPVGSVETPDRSLGRPLHDSTIETVCANSPPAKRRVKAWTPLFRRRPRVSSLTCGERPLYVAPSISKFDVACPALCAGWSDCSAIRISLVRSRTMSISTGARRTHW